MTFNAGSVSARDGLKFYWLSILAEKHVPWTDPTMNLGAVYWVPGAPSESMSVDDRTPWNQWGFGVRSSRGVAHYSHSADSTLATGAVFCPHWFALLVTAMPAAWWVVWMRGVLRQRRRGRLGLCLACGYDLRSSPERCPECGRARAGEGHGREGEEEN